MFSWLAEKLISHNMRRLNAGDIRATLRIEADDVTLHFPGTSSWSGDHRGKPEVRAWLERFAREGFQIFPDEVIVKGLPWSQTICVRGHIYLRGAGGETAYENRYVIWGRLVWGRLREYEVYEDTQKAAALDEYLLAREQPAIVS